MGSRVELFEQIRRDRDREGLSIRALAVRHGVHRPLDPTPRARTPSGQRRPARALSRERPRWGYRRAHARLVEEGFGLI
jgi:hypothetical protein